MTEKISFIGTVFLRLRALWAACRGTHESNQMIITKTRLLSVAIFLSAGLAACGSGPGDATGSTCPKTMTLTYANFGQAFIQNHCLACHSASGPESPKLDTLAQVRAAASDIDKSAAAGPNGVNTYMPEGSSVDEAERRKLGEWLACGAPE